MWRLRNIRKEFFRKIILLFLLIATFIMIMPLFMLINGSLMGKTEIYNSIKVIFNKNSNLFASWPIIVNYPTLKGYVELLLDTPKFFVMFWNSCKIVFGALFGQVIVAVPAGWAFAIYKFKGRRFLFSIYIMLMILPFQVTMVSTYLIFDKLNFMNTYYCLILPNIFLTLPVFIITKFFKSIPIALIESARIDGASEFDIFMFLGIPLGKPGILSALIISFLDMWNNIEQPMVFLKNKSLWPLSLFMPNISEQNLSLAFAAAIIMLIPSLLIFITGQRYLEKGITACGLKE